MRLSLSLVTWSTTVPSCRAVFHKNVNYCGMLICSSDSVIYRAVSANPVRCFLITLTNALIVAIKAREELLHHSLTVSFI